MGSGILGFTIREVCTHHNPVTARYERWDRCQGWGAHPHPHQSQCSSKSSSPPVRYQQVHVESLFFHLWVPFRAATFASRRRRRRRNPSATSARGRMGSFTSEMEEGEETF